MSYVSYTGAKVTGVVEEMVKPGATVGIVSKRTGLSPSTLRWWYVLGAPVDAPGIPAGTPLLIAALRHHQGVTLDSPISDLERLTVLRMASQRRLHLIGQFLKYFAEEH